MTISKYATLKSTLLAATILVSPLILAAPTPANAQVVLGVSIQIAPPLLPVHVQPPIPEAGYIWTPGYWAWSQPVGYYWVPGSWIQPPIIGVLWTPPYWGWNNGAYVFFGGYWGPHVGFYGGVNYGYGYGGNGYDGGRWNGGNFAYNQSANNFGSVHVANTYEQNLTVTNRTNVSYVGGANGLRTEPTAEERSAGNETHIPMTAAQTSHMTTAASNPAFAASHNNGHPAIAAVSRPAQFEGAAAHTQPAGTAEHTVAPANAAHPAEHAAESAAVAHPAEHAVEPAAVAHPVAHATEPAAAPHAAAQAAVTHAAARPAAPRPAAIQHAVARPAAQPTPRPAVLHAAAPHAAPAAAHAAPAHEEEKK